MRGDNNIDFSGYSIESLEAIQRTLAEILPSKTLLDVNLEHELLNLLRTGQQLMHTVLSDLDVPANQKAQVINSLASTIDQLVKLQNSVHDSERVKRLEHVFTKTLKSLPTEVAESALQVYQREWKKQFE